MADSIRKQRPKHEDLGIPKITSFMIPRVYSHDYSWLDYYYRRTARGERIPVNNDMVIVDVLDLSWTGEAPSSELNNVPRYQVRGEDKPVPPPPPKTIPTAPSVGEGLPPESTESPPVVTSAKSLPKGTVAWKQGIGYWVLKPPYSSAADRQFMLEKPKDTTIVASAREAASTIQTMGGPALSTSLLNRGIVSPGITSTRQLPTISGRQASRLIGNLETKTTTVQQPPGTVVGPYIVRSGTLTRRTRG